MHSPGRTRPRRFPHDADTTQGLTLGDCAADADAGEASEAAADAEAPCVWVLATVNIGGVIVQDWVWVCGNTVTVWVPNDPALIGLPITVTLPGGAQACGTVTL